VTHEEQKKETERIREGNETERQIKFITEHTEDTDRVKRREINVCVQTKEEVTDHRGKDKTSLVPKHNAMEVYGTLRNIYTAYPQPYKKTINFTLRPFYQGGNKA
jgi:hypothetical protein